MFCKLAFKNVKKSIKDYLLYFFTLAFGVAIFYIFNSLDSQKVMLDITSAQGNIIDTIVEMIGILSMVVACILAFLILYANKFMIKRRKKELGIYMTLGMGKRKISGMLVLETLIIGVLSLLTGLAVGVFASQGLSVVTAKLFDVYIKEFRFVFSSAAFYKSIVYFGIIFLVVMVFNTVIISKCKLIDLIYAEKKNETLKMKKLWVSVVVFILAVALIGVAYYMLLNGGMLVIGPTFYLMLLIGTVGTLLFFMSLSGFLLRMVKSSKRLYYKNLNMFVMRQLNSKVNTTYVSMTVICIMLLLTIGILSTVAGFNNALKDSTDRLTPYDMTARITLDEQKETDVAGLLEKGYAAQGTDLDTVYRAKYQYHTYVSDATMNDVFGEELRGKVPSSVLGGSNYYDEYMTEVIKASDYRALMQMQGKEPVSLGTGEYLVLNYTDLLDAACQGLVDTNRTVTINGHALSPSEAGMRGDVLYTSASLENPMLLVVPDEVTEGLEVSLNYFVGNYRASSPESEDSRLQAVMESIREELRKQDGGYFYNIETKEDIYENNMGLKSIFIFVGLYLGVIFLIAGAAILALAQLSSAADNIRSYGLLKKLGTEDRMMNRSIFIQVFLYFFLPLGLAIIHSIVGIHVANQMVALFGKVDATKNILFTAAVILVVYGGYFLATYFGCKGIIKNSKRA